MRARIRLPADIDALLFVALVWAAQTYLLFRFIIEQAVDAPHYDEWEMVPALTGNQPITLDWLWSQHNEHRIFLPRLVYLLVEALASNDFRAGALFDGMLLCGLAVAFCAAARKIRGELRYSDAFFPLLLLHWGQAENLLGSIQIAFVLGAALALVAVLVLAVRDESQAASAFILAACALSLALVGGHGIALAPSVALCALIAAWQLRRAGRPPRIYASLASLSLFTFVLIGLYFVDYQRPERHPVSPSMISTLQAATHFLASGFGSGHKAYWPLGGYVMGLVAFPCLVALCAALLQRPDKRLRILSMILFIGGMLALALGIGWARAAFYSQGLFVSRYVTLALPLLCAFYLSWELMRLPRWSSFMQFFLFAVLAVMTIRNRDDGYADALAINVIRHEFKRDIDNRMPISELARKHCGNVYYVCDGTVLNDRIRMLRAYEVPGFAQLPD